MRKWMTGGYAVCLWGASVGLAGGEECRRAAEKHGPCGAETAKANLHKFLTADGTTAPDTRGCGAHESRFVAHEWGTFTSFSGSDGVILDHRPAIGEDLPGFVYDRAEWTGDGSRIALESDKSQLWARQRMETPVIYFYTDEPRDVRVRVSFPQGLITEFYPSVTAMTPPLLRGKPEPIERSMIEWNRLTVIPTDQLSASGAKALLGHAPSLPAVDPREHYGQARDTASAWIRASLGDPNGSNHRDEWEKFLFYRGVGNFALPVTFRVEGDQRMVLTNRGPKPLPAVFVLSDVCCGNADIKFAQYANVSGERVLDQPLKLVAVHEAGEALTKALMAAGLYELEARAMVKTWQASWFTEPGLRVLYVVPRELTDQILPLEIEPKPQEVVRVLVGRIEAMSPANERDLAATISNLGNSRDAERATAEQTLAKYGRFAEPALRRAAATTENPDIRTRAEAVIQKLRAKS